MEKYINLAGRILLSHIFILAGFNKITGYAGTQGYMESVGVPGMLLPLVIILELGGGLAILAGWQTRIAAYLLAGFTILAAIIFHPELDHHFMKNLAIAGGFLILAVNGAGAMSLDGRSK